MKTHFRRSSAALLVYTLSLVVAACGSDDGREDFEAGLLGAVEIAPGEAIQIRTLLTHSARTEIGLPLRRSAEMAVSDYGPIYGRAVELGDPVDTLCSAEGGKAGALQIVEDPGSIVGVIGTACSVAAVEASPILSGAGLVMVSPGNTSPDLTSDLAGNPSPDYFPGYYRVSNNNFYQATTVAYFAYEKLGLRAMATVDDGDPYTMGLTDAFANTFEKLGARAAPQVRIDKGQMDMQDVVAEIAEAYAGSGPGLTLGGVFFPLFTEEAIPFIQQAKANPSLADAVFITAAGPLVPSFLALPESLGVYFAAASPLDTSNVNEATGVSGAEALAAYHATYGTPETPYWAQAYDAATVLLGAIEDVAEDIGGTLYVDRALLRQALTGTEGFEGLIGALTCDDFGDCGTGSETIYHHNDPTNTDPGGLEPVYP